MFCRLSLAGDREVKPTTALGCVCLWLGSACTGGAGGLGAGDVRTTSRPNAPPLSLELERLDTVDPVDREFLERARSQIEADVRLRRQRRHGSLPAVQRSEARSPASWPEVSVRNDTPHALVVWFSGPCPRTLALPPRGRLTDELCEGDYDVAAELASDDFLPFVGESNQVDSGFRYTLTFYVVAAPTRRVRHR